MRLQGILILALTLAAQAALAQQQTDTAAARGTTPAQVRVVPAPQPLKKPQKPKFKPLMKEFSGGLRLNSDGWSVFVDKGRLHSQESGPNIERFHDVRLWQIEFAEKKDPREYKSSQTNDPSGGSSRVKPVIFGKANNFYTLKFGMGNRRLIAGKPEEGTVSIHWVYLGGVSLGLEKPYYINAYVNQGGSFVEQTIKYSEETKADFLDEQKVIGSAGFSQGIGETKFVPGLHFKTGLHFDFSTRRRTKMAIEAGVNGELYSRGIEIMAGQKAVPYFGNLYASFQFGSRY
jgi:hypothetical protein